MSCVPPHGEGSCAAATTPTVSRRRSLRAAAARRGRGRGAHGPVEVGPELGVVLKVELRGAGDEGVHGDMVLEVLQR